MAVGCPKDILFICGRVAVVVGVALSLASVVVIGL